jgi:hypothetical protein
MSTPPPVPGPPAGPSEQEYEHLISHFERLIRLTVVIIGIISAVGLGMFYKSLADVKSEAKASVDQAKTSAQTEIASAKQEVLDTVKAEARKRVDEEFNSNDITQMVEAAAKRKVGRTIDRQIQDEVSHTISHLQDQMVQTAEVGDLGMRMRVGFRDAFDELRQKYRETDDEGLRRTEKIILDSITADYEERWTSSVRRHKITALQSIPSQLAPGEKAPVSTSDLVKMIRDDKNLDNVCLSFLALRDGTGVHFVMFDTEAVEKWCTENKSKCE